VGISVQNTLRAGFYAADVRIAPFTCALRFGRMSNVRFQLLYVFIINSDVYAILTQI
jgi:hypothetical protein